MTIFSGKKLLRFTKVMIFSGLKLAIDQNERYFSIFLDTLGAFNKITLLTNGNKLD